jgi:hypothetical protein
MSFLESPAKKLLKKLALKFGGLSFLLRSSKHRKRGLEAGKPGEIIENLSPEDRELIKQLTSEEAQSTVPDFGHIDIICDEYWEKKYEEDRYKGYLNGTKARK